MTQSIPFNKPFVIGKELYYIAQAVALGNISCDGHFTRACSELLQQRFGISKILMTPSCTAALEMAAMLCDLGPGDEVLMPSFTFVSTANAVARLGAKPVFVDIRPDTLNIDERLLAPAITPRTRAIFPVHYAGIGCAMDRIMEVAERHHLWVVEDAAQGVNSEYQGRPLGAIGHLGAYSFHETKNYMCGEGGALCINSPELVRRAEIIRDKGTNRQQFYRGEVDKYTWVDIGSSYVPCEIVSAFLYAQLEHLDAITQKRRGIYQYYRERLTPFEAEGLLGLPVVPPVCQGNYHLFYVLLADGGTRDRMMAHLREQGIGAVFHYVPLHTSPMGRQFGYQEGDLPITEDLSQRLLRLPMYHEITAEEQSRVVTAIASFLRQEPARAPRVRKVRSSVERRRCA